MTTEFLKPKWDHFDGEQFQDLICDLLRKEGFEIEPSGVGPDGGLDAIATQRIVFGYNNPENFRWGVQCKFSKNANSSIGPSSVGNVLNIVHDERFKNRGVNGYFLASNVRLSTNLMSELRGLNNCIPGFKTTYWDRSFTEDLLNKHWVIFSKYFDEQQREPLPLTDQPISKISEHFEMLLTKKDATEAELCMFFNQFPQLLLPSEPIEQANPQVILEAEEGHRYIPDFLILPKISKRWVIVELKSPRASMFVNRQGRVRFSASVLEGCSQLREYRAYFDSKQNREFIRNKYGIDVVRPRMILVVGMDYGDLDMEQIIRIKDDIPALEIITYSDLLNQIKAIES